MDLVVLQHKSRRQLCLACDFVDLRADVGEEYNGPGTKAPEAYFVCDRIKMTPPMVPCQMKSMLRDPNADCPHPELELRIEWKYAELDPRGSCGGNAPPPGTASQPPPPPVRNPNVEFQATPVRRGIVESPILIERLHN